MARGCCTARASNDHSTQAGRRLAVRAAFALHLYTQPRTPFCRCPRSIEDGEITKYRRTPSSGGTHRYGWQKSESFEPYEPGPRSGPSSRPLPSRCARHPPPGRGWASNMEEENVALKTCRLWVERDREAAEGGLIKLAAKPPPSPSEPFEPSEPGPQSGPIAPPPPFEPEPQRALL